MDNHILVKEIFNDCNLLELIKVMRLSKIFFENIRASVGSVLQSRPDAACPRISSVLMKTRRNYRTVRREAAKPEFVAYFTGTTSSARSRFGNLRRA